MEQGDLFRIWFAEAVGYGTAVGKKVYHMNLTPYDFYEMDEETLASFNLFTERQLQRLCDKNLDTAKSIETACRNKQIKTVSLFDEGYPPLLAEIDRPPLLLYYLGTLPNRAEDMCIGMVGTRKMTENGLCNAYRIAHQLAQVDITVISGMALGIDGVSAGGALHAKGKTVAVLGCGVNIVYPKQHETLRNEILRNGGCVLSEFAPGTAPSGYHFPLRNRIISGLSVGLIVVEAGEGSGSLITAEDALQQGRDVFAMPANVSLPSAQGTNELLRKGARLLLDVSDVQRVYGCGIYNNIHWSKIAKEKTTLPVDMEYLANIGVLVRDSVGGYTLPIGKNTGTEKKKATPQEPVSGSPIHPPEDNKKNPSPAEKKPKEPASKKKETTENLTDIQLQLLRCIPDDRAISMNELMQTGIPTGQLMTQLMLLEMSGVLQKLPGNQYIKA